MCVRALTCILVPLSDKKKKQCFGKNVAVFVGGVITVLVIILSNSKVGPVCLLGFREFLSGRITNSPNAVLQQDYLMLRYNPANKGAGIWRVSKAENDTSNLT